MSPPFRLLEINIISAQDLPPVSKMLRTFAVAYIDPDHKLTTKIDHQGHTNPTWNYKVLFHVDEKFLTDECSAVTIEIYNLAWLRDLPIGTTSLNINNLSPPLSKNSGFRRVALQICRPSGHLQGTLNLIIQLVDNTVPGSEISMSSYSEQIEEEEEDQDHIQEGNDSIRREEVDINPGPEVQSRIDSRCTSPERLSTIGPVSEHETRTVASTGSCFSVMRPLPSEIASDLRKGFYSQDWSEYGSSIFDNWTEEGDESEELTGGKLNNNVVWPEEELILMAVDKKHDSQLTKKSNTKTGLLSCFGKAYGFHFSFICGSSSFKKRKKRSKSVNDLTMPRFYA